MNQLDKQVFMILHQRGKTIATWGRWQPSKKEDQTEQLEEFIEDEGMKEEYDVILKRIANGDPTTEDRVKAFIEVMGEDRHS